MAEEKPKPTEKANQARKPVRKKRSRRIAVEEWHRTIRLGMVLAAIAVCVWKISDAVVKIMEKPPWLVALSTILSIFFAAGIQSPLFYGVVMFIKKWTREHVARESRLEELIDKNRASSGLTTEGTDPKRIDHET
jgi:hypothetical protein